jgi:hypothetical protein
MIPLATVGRAALVGMIVALVVDIALQAALASVRTGFQPIALMGSGFDG